MVKEDKLIVLLLLMFIISFFSFNNVLASHDPGGGGSGDCYRDCVTFCEGNNPWCPNGAYNCLSWNCECTCYSYQEHGENWVCEPTVVECPGQKFCEGNTRRFEDECTQSSPPGCIGSEEWACGAHSGCVVLHDQFDCFCNEQGWADCDGDRNSSYPNGCETNILTNFSNCGSCGNACNSGQTCVNGVCVGGGPQSNYCSGHIWYNIQNPHNQMNLLNCNLASNYNCVTNISSGNKFNYFCFENSSGRFLKEIKVGQGSGGSQRGEESGIKGFFQKIWDFLTGRTIGFIKK